MSYSCFLDIVLICRSVREGLKNDEIAVVGDQWPVSSLVYADCAYYDPEAPWELEGLFRNKLLVWVLPLYFNL